MSLLFYKRPDYVATQMAPKDPAEYQRRLERTRKAIPPELSFEMVVSNRAMPPCSLQDFMGYLLYVSYEAENLQFYLWFQDYSRRFTALSRVEKELSPPCDDDTLLSQVDPSADQGPRMLGPQNSDRSIPQMKEMYVESKERPPLSQQSTSSCFSGTRSERTLNTLGTTGTPSGLEWDRVSIQPFRAEINRITSHYLIPGGPRELNLSYKERAACVQAVKNTTHPSALYHAARTITRSLRDHAHPNFIRWSMINGNKPRMILGNFLASTNILFGFIIAILLTLSYQPRWWRLWSLFPWLVGFSLLLAGSNGVCLVLYVTKDRHLRPWEQFANTSVESLESQTPSSWDTADDATTLAGSDTFSLSQMSYSASKKNGRKKANVSLEFFGARNTHAHEAWVEKYRSKMLFRKIFDSTVWVQNEHLRIIQDKVAFQAVAWSAMTTVVLAAVFTALPRGHFF